MSASQGVSREDTETGSAGVPRGILGAAVIALGVSVAVLLFSLGQPIIDQHGFRQTQTAISVYSMLHGGPWLDYETPVLGYPWSVPFEFPLYQWIVAGLVKLTGMAIDPAGRIVSYLWLLLSLPPARSLFRSYCFSNSTFLIYATFLLASPLYLVWGRAFLIETQALSLSIWMLALVRSFTERPRIWIGLAAMLTTVAAMLTKPTTLPPFLLLAGLMIVRALYRDRSNRPRLAQIIGGSGAIFLPALLLTAAWTHHADALKMANPLGGRMRSGAPEMLAWNFGSFGQRFSPDFVDAILRAMSDVAGPAGIAVLAGLIGLILLRPGRGRREAYTALLMLAAFLLPFEIFTNLHFVHNYYQAANGAFLVAALALAVAAAGERLGARTTVLFVATVLSSQFIRFGFADLPRIAHPPEQERALATYVRNHAPTGSAVVTVGLDWSPVVPYYAERKALMIPNWPEIILRDRLRAADKSLGGLAVGAWIVCSSEIQEDIEVQDFLVTLAEARRHQRVAGCDVYI